MSKTVREPEWIMDIPSPEDWAGFATRLLEFAGPPRLIALYGPMGAGKTTLVRELCRQLEVVDVVASPTFAIVYEYITRLSESVFHMDFYRIKNPGEVFDMGYEEYFFSERWCFIEWPELVEEMLPPGTLRVFIGVENSGLRKVRVMEDISGDASENF